MLCYVTVSLSSQFLALSAHGPECHIEHVGGLLISNSRIKRLLLAGADPGGSRGPRTPPGPQRGGPGPPLPK